MIHEGTVNGEPALIENEQGRGGDATRVAIIPREHSLRRTGDGQIVGVIDRTGRTPKRFDPVWREVTLNDRIQIVKQSWNQSSWL
jgi:hypothetical protein